MLLLIDICSAMFNLYIIYYVMTVCIHTIQLFLFLIHFCIRLYSGYLLSRQSLLILTFTVFDCDVI